MATERGTREHRSIFQEKLGLSCGLFGIIAALGTESCPSSPDDRRLQSVRRLEELCGPKDRAKAQNGAHGEAKVL